MSYKHDLFGNGEVLLVRRPESSNGRTLDYYGPSSRDFSEHDRSQFLEYLHILRRHVFSITLLMLIGVGIGALLSSLKSPVYRARTTLDIQEFNENIFNMNRGVGTEAAPANSPGESYIQTEIKLIQSESMAGRVIAKLNASAAAPSPAMTASALSAWTDTMGQRGSTKNPNDAKPQVREQRLAKLGKSLKVRTLGTTRIVEVLCDGEDARMATDFCNTLADEYITQNSETRLQTTQETVEWLSHQLEGLRARLAQSEEKLEESAKASGLVFSIEDQSVSQDKLRLLQSELSMAKSERMKKQSMFEMANSGPREALSFVSEGPLREYQLRLTDLQRQRAELSATLTPAHYKVQELDSQIRLLQSTIEKERSMVLSQMNGEYHAAARREGLLTSEYDSQIAGISDEAAKAVQYNMLKREVESGRQLYEAMLHRVEELGVASAMRASTIRVVDRATLPTHPFTPNWPGNCLGGAVSGCLLGFGFAFVRSRSDRSLQEPGDATSLLNVRELGVIPATSPTGFVPSIKGRPALLFPQPAINGGPNDDLNIMRDPELEQCLELVTFHRKHAVIAESFSATMNSILFADRNGASAQVLVITSPEAGDGKSTVASNLAITLAQIGRKVLLIDGDLRRPRLSGVFGYKDQEGLLEYLRSPQHLQKQPIQNLIRQTQVPNLFVLPSGNARMFESKLLHSNLMGALIEKVRQQFNIILIDTPPMIQISDARVFGHMSDGVVLVLRAGKTSLEVALAAQRYLTEDGTKILGTVLNDWNSRNSVKFRKYSEGYREIDDEKRMVM